MNRKNVRYAFVINDFFIGGVEESFLSLLDVLGNPNVDLYLLNQKFELNYKFPGNVSVINAIKSEYKEKSFLSKKPISMIRKYGLVCTFKHYLYYIINKIKKNTQYSQIVAFYKKNTFHYKACFVLKENEPTLFYALKKIKSDKLICFFHTSGYFEKNYRKFYESQKVDSIITVSKGNCKFLCEHMPLIKDKISVVHNYLDVAKIIDLSKKETNVIFPKDKIKIITVGRIEENKGILRIFEVSEKLVENNIDFIWFVVGPPNKGTSLEEWIAKSNEAGLGEKIIFTNYVENPYPLILNSDFLVSPSYAESFCLQIREAQILEKPVIATSTFGSEELIHNKKTGVICKNETRSLANTIVQVCIHADLLNKISSNLKLINFDEKCKIREKLEQIIRK